MSMFLDITGILGESESPNSNWNQKIEITNMGYQVHQDSTSHTGSGLVPSMAKFYPMEITKSMDKSTPILWGKLAGGEPIPTVVVRVSRPGGTGTGPQGGLFEAETYTMSNVIIQSYSTSGKLGAGGLPTERWMFSFTAITEVFNSVDSAGNLQPVQQAGYNIAGGAAMNVGHPRA